jgi:hypothetical protein
MADRPRAFLAGALRLAQFLVVGQFESDPNWVGNGIAEPHHAQLQEKRFMIQESWLANYAGVVLTYRTDAHWGGGFAH